MAYKILLADDQPHNLIILKRYLLHTGKEHITIEAKNGREACDLAYQENPDLIIMDWEMPEMDGIEAIRELKSKSQTLLIPIIMATAHDSSEHVKQAMDEGAMDYIIKPSNKVELSARVNSALRISDLNKQNRKQTDEIVQQNKYIRKRSEYYVLLKNRVFRTFLAYAVVAFVVSVVSFLFFKQMGKSLDLAQSSHSMSIQVYKMLDAGQILLAEELVIKNSDDHYLSKIFDTRTVARDSARHLLVKMRGMKDFEGFGISEECDHIEGLMKQYDVIFNRTVELYFDMMKRRGSTYSFDNPDFSDLISKIEYYSEETNTTMDAISEKVKRKGDSDFSSVELLVVCIVTVSVIFTMFLTVSIQFFFGDDDALNEMKKVEDVLHE